MWVWLRCKVVHTSYVHTLDRYYYTFSLVPTSYVGTYRRMDDIGCKAGAKPTWEVSRSRRADLLEGKRRRKRRTK